MSIFKPQRFIMHIAAKDACALILSVTKSTFSLQHSRVDKITLRVCWFNRGFTGNPWELGLIETITLQNEQLNEWRDVTDEMYKPREIA